MADGDLIKIGACLCAKPKRTSDKLCVGLGCVKTAWARGMCKTHYSRWRLHGDCEQGAHHPLPTKCEVDGCDRKPRQRWQKAKAVCNRHWQYFHRYGVEYAPEGPLPEPLGTCSAAGCLSIVRTRNCEYCEKHYYRLRRGAPLADKVRPTHRYTTKEGYVVRRINDHPLAGISGVLGEHRVVAYEKYGGQCPSCFWCDGATSWRECHVDHLNGVKNDNAPDNLVVACSFCNRMRGAAWPFLVSLTPEAWGKLAELVHESRLNASNASQSASRIQQPEAT